MTCKARSSEARTGAKLLAKHAPKLLLMHTRFQYSEFTLFGRMVSSRFGKIAEKAAAAAGPPNGITGVAAVSRKRKRTATKGN